MSVGSRRREKIMRRNTIIIGIIIVFLMVFSMFAIYVDNQESSQLKYGNFSFVVEQTQNGQMVSTKVNGQKYYFYTLPDNAETAVGNLTGLDRIAAAGTLIFTKDPLKLNEQASSERLVFDSMISDLNTNTGRNIRNGLTTNGLLSAEQVFTCANATPDSPVIALQEGTYITISMNETGSNCFLLQSDGANLLILRDYLLYRSLGIITN